MLKPVAPNTKLTRLGYVCLLAGLPAILFKVWHRLTGQPIDYMSKTAATLGGLFMFGWISGFLLLGIETIRSAWRDKS